MTAINYIHANFGKIQKWFPVVGVLLFAYVLSSIEFDSIERVLSESTPFYFVVGIFFVLVSLFIKCVRHFIILRSQNIDINFKSSVSIYFKSIFWGLASPGRIGEFSKVLYLKKHVDSNVKSIANVVIDRIFDLFSIVIILLLSVSFVEIQYKKEIIGIILAGVCLAFVLAIVLSRRFRKIQNLKWAKIGEFFNELFLLKNKAAIFAITITSLVVYYAGLFALAKGIGLTAGFSFIVFCCAASNLIAIIPISFAGIGTRDLFLIHMFRTASYSAEQAVIFSAFFILIYLMVMCISYLFILGGGRGGRKSDQDSGGH